MGIHEHTLIQMDGWIDEWTDRQTDILRFTDGDIDTQVIDGNFGESQDIYIVPNYLSIIAY